MAAREGEQTGRQQRRGNWDQASSDEEEIRPAAVRPILDDQGRPVGEGVDPAALRRVIDHMPPEDAGGSQSR